MGLSEASEGRTDAATTVEADQSPSEVPVLDVHGHNQKGRDVPASDPRRWGAEQERRRAAGRLPDSRDARLQGRAEGLREVRAGPDRWGLTKAPHRVQNAADKLDYR